MINCSILVHVTKNFFLFYEFELFYFQFLKFKERRLLENLGIGFPESRLL